MGAVALGAVAPFASANETPPLSAIEWLSDSIAITEDDAPASNDGPSATLPPAISVAPLDAPIPDNVGLISAGSVGLDLGIWGRSASSDLADLIRSLPDAQSAVPSLRAFVHDLMIARLDPPIDAIDDDGLFLARLDALLDLGQLGSAHDMIAAAGVPEPRRFRRAFDIALLTGTETEICKVVAQTPDISPTYPARIFCLARGGQWDVAALTLGNAEALGILSDDEHDLLLHFLDPELFEGEPIPTPPQFPSPLTFRLYEAVGERMSTDPLPVAFAAADLTDTVGWQTRLRAVERLAAADAVSFETLLSVYSERSPAASGAIWQRVKTFQSLLSAIESADDQKFEQHFPEAWALASQAHFQASFARWIAPKLSGRELARPAAHAAFEIALTAGRPNIAKQFTTDSTEDRFLVAIATGEGTTPPPNNVLGRGIVRGLSAIGPGRRYQTMIDDGRAGEALLDALAALMEGATGNPDRTSKALALLRELGLENLARQVSVDLLLHDGAA